MITQDLTVERLFKEQAKSLRLDLLAGKRGLGRLITVPEINRPGLALAGFLEHFSAERVQVFGRGEQSYCMKVGSPALRKSLSSILASKEMPCILFTHGLDIPPVLLSECDKRGIPLFRSQLKTADLVSELGEKLEYELSPSCLVHGVFVDIYGMGVLIQGGAGMGKSECALELLKRGHILIADDVVRLQHRRGGVLRGICPEPLKNHLEVRGLGILDVSLLFGIGFILEHKRVRLAVQLLPWEKVEYPDRTGLSDTTVSFLGIDIPQVRIPVMPGRNLAVLIEVAALNQRLKIHGYHAAENFNQKLIDRMREAGKK